MILLGSTYVDEGYKSDKSPKPDEATISFESLERITSSCKEISTHLNDCELQRIWRGWRPCSKDDYPIFGPDPINKNIIYAQGFLGLGITLSVAVGDCITNYVAREERLFPNQMDVGLFK